MSTSPAPGARGEGAENLTITIDGEDASYTLRDGESLTIGRQDNCEIQCFDDSISRQHAKLTRRGERVFVEPFTQPCPTLVGDRPVPGASRIRSGQTLTIGGVEVRVVFKRDLPNEAPLTSRGGAKETVFQGGGIRVIQEWFDLDVGLDEVRLRKADEHRIVARAPWVKRDGAQFITIGRAEECDLVLSGEQVSARHAELKLVNRTVTVRDLGSANYTGLNKEQLTRDKPRDLAQGAHLQIGGLDLRLMGEALASGVTGPHFSVSARDLSFLVPDKKGGMKPVLQDVFLELHAGELVAVKGLSGSGKSVLLGLLSGRTKPSIGSGTFPDLGEALGDDGKRVIESKQRAVHGHVLYSGFELSKRIEDLRPYIGYVADENACMPGLTVAQWLRCAGRLRVPGIGSAEIERRIDKAIDDLALLPVEGTKKKKLAELSLGQRKRILLATELVADTPVLFVDEVTSNVDVGSEEKILRVLREKAGKNHLVIMITHHDVNLEDFDTVLFMCRGRLVYAGNDPRDMLQFFKATDYRDLNKVVASDSDEPVQIRRAALLEHEFLADERRSRPINEFKRSPFVPAPDSEKVPGPGVTSLGRQLRALFTRNAQAFVRDRGAMFCTLLLGPLITLFLSFILGTNIDYKETAKKLDIDVTSMNLQVIGEGLVERMQSGPEFWEERNKILHRMAFQPVLVVVVILAALLIASMQIVKEHHMYVHERTVGVRRDAYLAAKMAWLTVVGAIIAFGIAYTTSAVATAGDPPGRMAMVLFGTAMSSLALGLAVSSLVKSTESALFLVLGITIVQVVFSGLIPGLGAGAAKAGYVIPAFYGVHGMQATLDLPTHLTLNSIAKSVGFDYAPMGTATSFLVNMVLTSGFLSLAWWGLKRKDARGVQRE